MDRDLDRRDFLKTAFDPRRLGRSVHHVAQWPVRRRAPQGLCRRRYYRPCARDERAQHRHDKRTDGGAMIMPTYEFLRVTCGLFEQRRRLQEAGEPLECRSARP